MRDEAKFVEFAACAGPARGRGARVERRVRWLERRTVELERIVVLIMGLLIASCSAPPVSPPAPDDALAGTEWRLVRLEGEPVEEGPHITLRFEEERLGGYAGCNWYGARYRVAGARLDVDPIEATARACADPRFGKREETFLEMLRSGVTLSIDDDRLLLVDNGNVPVAEFVRRHRFDSDPRQLIGTEWELRSVDGNPLLPGSTITIGFDRDTFRGFAGCRRYEGTYGADRDELAVTSISMTTEVCASEELLLQEQQYTTDLSEAAQFRIREENLEITTHPGRLLLFVPRKSS
jgi:heat shock protein HslJ